MILMKTLQFILKVSTEQILVGFIIKTKKHERTFNKYEKRETSSHSFISDRNVI